MRIGRVLAPLVSGVTYRRGVHLLLGGVILIPYLVLAVGFWQLYLDPNVPVVPITVLAAVTLVIATLPPFLPALRSLEIVAARSLLDVPLPDPEATPSWPTRARAASWYVLHLVSGGVVGFALTYGVPVGVLMVTDRLGGDVNLSVYVEPLPLRDLPTAFVVPLAVAMMVGTVYVIAGLGSIMAAIAPALLGPSQEERIAALEAQAERLAERNRLARELHDSVGHALTVTTVQAAAARRMLDTDPEFVRRALLAVEETGRAAMEDLDHVLGVLRADAEGRRPPAPPAPQRTLAALPELLGDMRAAGVVVRASVTGDLAAVSPAASREAYRIVQESLTNAVRHARGVPVTVSVVVGPDDVDVEVTNPLVESRAATPGGGRGLRGMRERVELLRGELVAGSDQDRWRVRARIPDADVSARGRST
ncbi:MAG TPA: histidine kinase [Jiangellaceae bacterium]